MRLCLTLVRLFLVSGFFFLVRRLMARSSKVPEFGKWDGGEDVQYTAYFDKASKAKSERLKPNDPSLHREEISETGSSKNVQHKTGEVDARRETESPLHRDALRGRDYDGLKSEKSQDQQASSSKHTQEDLNLEDGNMKKHLDSSLEHQTKGGQVSFNSPNNTASSSSVKTARNVAGSDGSIENSPLQHPRTEAKIVVPSSPLRDRRGSSSPKGGSLDFIASLTPGRSRERSVPRGNETEPDQSVTVPKFGDWDESDPSASDNYSNIFTQVRDERRTEDGTMPVGTNVYSNRSAAENSKKCCCFPWGK